MWVCQCPVPSTGTVREKVPRYVFVTWPLCGETNWREAFLNCAASCLFIVRYEDGRGFRLLVHAQVDHPCQLWKRLKGRFPPRIGEPSRSGARQRSEPGARTVMNSLSVFQVSVPLTPVPGQVRSREGKQQAESNVEKTIEYVPGPRQRRQLDRWVMEAADTATPASSCIARLASQMA